MKKNKKRHVLKKTISTLLAVATISGIIPASKYRFARRSMPFDAKSISEYEPADKTKKVCEIFADGINKNGNLPAEYKEKIIEAFTELFLKDNGQYLTEEAIINMWAVARTEKVEELSDFVINHGWWGGDYNPFLNKCTLGSTSDKALIAHEQLHAILKHGSFGSGLTNFLLGYSLNEGWTSLSIKNEKYSDTYNNEQWQANYFSLILGLEKVYEYYLNHDLSSLLKEMTKYLTLPKSIELLALMDINIFSSYFKTFMYKNIIKDSSSQNSFDNDMEEKSKNINNRIKELLIELYQNKNQNKLDNLGNLIFKSAYFSSENSTIDDIFYEITIIDPNTIGINFAKNIWIKSKDNGIMITFLEKSFECSSEEIGNIDLDKLIEEVKKDFERQKEMLENGESNIISR